MKQGLHFILPVEVDVNLDNVSKIRFKFSQEKLGHEKIFDYPSTTATRVTGTNVINLEWTQADTYGFQSNSTMRMDTFITMTNTAYNPETEIIDLTLNQTLFSISEVTDEEDDET